MKSILTVLLLGLLATGISANDYIPATLVFADGREMNGFVRRIEHAYAKHIRFKEALHLRSTKQPSKELKTVIFYDQNDTLEFDRLHSYHGWKRDKVAPAMWLRVLERGHATLLHVSKPMRNTVKPNELSPTRHEHYWLCIRQGEDVASLLSVHSSNSLLNNDTFRKKAPDYFKDYPELANKIRSKWYSYQQIHEVVRLYNQWASSQVQLD